MRRDPIEIEVELPEPTETKTILVRVDSDLHAEAERIRKLQGHTWRAIIEAALESYVKKYQ
jgi:hypothetical protein